MKLYYFNQNDYGNVAYNKPNGTTATVKSGGCGVVSACIVFDTLAGKKLYTPETMAEFSIDHGARTNSGTDEKTLLKALCAKNKGFSFTTTNDVAEVVKHLQNGGMAICNQGDAYNVFSTEGHFVVAYKMNGRNIEVVDPKMYKGKYDSYSRPSRIVAKTDHGCIVTKTEMNKATHDRNPRYYLVTYKGGNKMEKTYFGVDISEHNGTVNWNELAKHIDFAILRIGWVGHGTHKLDKMFEANYHAAKEAGVKLGAYVYMYTKSTDAAKEGAKWILKQIEVCTFDMPIYCDMEDESIAGLGKKTLSAIATAFCDTIAKGGYEVGIYANKYWFDEKLNKNLRTKYHTWIAHYTSGTDKYKGEFEMWQNSSTGHVDGVKGNVDTNYLYKDIFTKAKEPEKKPAPTEHKGYSNGSESFDSAYKNGKAFTVSAASALWLRQKPVDGKTIVAMPHGAKVMWYGFYTKVGNVIWRYVQYKHNGKTYEGFCSGKYLK